MIFRRFGLLVALMLVAGCSGLGQTPPPPPFSPESLATALKLTENAPPAGYEQVAFPKVDQHLEDMSAFHYMLEVRFDGVIDANLQPVSGVLRAEVWWDGIAPARRVVLRAEGGAFAGEIDQLEAVRLIEDYYLVNEDGRCLINIDDTARAAANLAASALIGGVRSAPYSGTQAILNGIQAYRYDVLTEQVDLPLITTGGDSVVHVVGELWVAPAYDVVTRYYANFDVSRVRLLDSEQSVSGQLYIRYDLTDLDEIPNISIPFGC
ncbi:MAG: hypothetical protein Kow0077_25010 [Anaerolineae bacterium]